MIRFFVIPPGSRSAFTPLGALRRGMLLAKSRGYRAQMQRFKRNAKRQKELRESAGHRGHYIVQSQIEKLSALNEADQASLDAWYGLDGGLDKPHEQHNMEWWLRTMQQEPRRYPRNP
jgi:hypothetical protein